MKKLIFILLSVVACSLSAIESKAQIKVFLSPTSVATETVVNTATAYVTSPVNRGPADETVIVVTVTKVSGTVGGTISLQGSLDNVSYKALNTVETQTALATITATDASNVYSWRLNGNPYQYYRVSWTGTGTMNATFGAKLVSH